MWTGDTGFTSRNAILCKAEVKGHDNICTAISYYHTHEAKILYVHDSLMFYFIVLISSSIVSRLLHVPIL